LNSQEVKFSDNLSVPATDGTQLRYILTGYVLFVGNHEEGHYKVICQGKDDRWFLYNDETTNCVTDFEREHYIHKRQVVLLLYAEQSYYNNTMDIDCSGALSRLSSVASMTNVSTVRVDDEDDEDEDTDDEDYDDNDIDDEDDKINDDDSSGVIEIVEAQNEQHVEGVDGAI
jgi:hypothetical protein